MTTFSEQLRKYRIKKGLTQQELASLLNINRVSYARWENNSREPNLETIVKLAKILDTTTDNLLGQTIYSRIDSPRFLDDFDVSDIKQFSKEELDKLKWAIMFEVTNNKVKALRLKDDLILKYHLDVEEREILNTIFAEVQKEMSDLFHFRN